MPEHKDDERLGVVEDDPTPLIPAHIAQYNAWAEGTTLGDVFEGKTTGPGHGIPREIVERKVAAHSRNYRQFKLAWLVWDLQRIGDSLTHSYGESATVGYRDATVFARNKVRKEKLEVLRGFPEWLQELADELRARKGSGLRAL